MLLEIFILTVSFLLYEEWLLSNETDATKVEAIGRQRDVSSLTFVNKSVQPSFTLELFFCVVTKMVRVTVDQRIIMKFDLKRGKPDSETYNLLKEVNSNTFLL